MIRRYRTGETYGHPAEGFVYVMECAGYYKIGWSASSPRKRLLGVQVGSPLPVSLVGVTEGTQITEAHWHEVFEAKRVRGEWFELAAGDIATILNEDIGVDHLPGEFDIA